MEDARKVPAAVSVRGSIAANLREKLDRFIENEVEVGGFPGGVYAVGDGSGIVAENALGHSVLMPAKINTSIDTLYDVASLTKPLITSTLVLRAVVDGKLELGERVSRFLPDLHQTDKRDLTFVDLLTHRGGFQAWYPLYTQGLGKQAYLQALTKRPLRYRPGTREIYSCLGFILLHLVLEQIYGRSGEDLASELIFSPLGLTRSRFNPPAQMKYQIAATEWGNANERRMVAQRGLTFSRFRRYMIWGEVNDGNAFYMGGNGGNAGLFSTAREVFGMARAYLARDERLLPAEVIDLSVRNYTLGLEENRGLGWQLPSTKASGPTAMLSEHAFGHTGFSGTSVWVDPDRNLIMVLLTNRLHPAVQPINMQNIRRGFHNIVTEEWDRKV